MSGAHGRIGPVRMLNTSKGVPPVPGENLSRDEARERAALLSVEGYEVSLDLRLAVGAGEREPRAFRSVPTIRFRCADPGATSFADLVAPSVTAVSLNGK